jgi:hypothetical protein
MRKQQKIEVVILRMNLLNSEGSTKVIAKNPILIVDNLE